MKKFFAAIILILLTSSAAAQGNSQEVDRGISSVKQKNFDFSVEMRLFVPNLSARVKSDGVYLHRTESPELIFKYKNFSLDYIQAHDDFHFINLKADKKIFSLMGTGLEWNVALNALDWNGSARNSSATRDYFAVLPSAGINLYARISPRLDLYVQFSTLPLGNRMHFADFESGVKYFPQKNFSINAGWRRIDFKLRRGGDVSDFALNGPFAGVRYNF